jgi:ATP-grasp domain/ATP-grasp N-terminal domain
VYLRPNSFALSFKFLPNLQNESRNGNQSAVEFFSENIWTFLTGKSTEYLAMTFVIPAQEGYMCHSNVLADRMASYELINNINQFVRVGENLRVFPGLPTNQDDFEQIMSSAVCGMTMKEGTQASLMDWHRDLDLELKNRISLPWNMPVRTRMKTLVIIGCHYPDSLRAYCLYANDLGIQLIMMESPDHWLHDEKLLYLGYFPILVDLEPDEGLVDRIVNAARSHPVKIDGITAGKDALLAVASRTAIEMQLPASPPEAFEVCVDKYATRQLNIGGYCKAILLESLDGLEQSVHFIQKRITYPFIVKPQQGGGSEGVQKVRDETELSNALVALRNYGSKFGAIIEEYEDGPEIDANFALCNGEITFFELVDDFPCKADEKNSSTMDSFLELDMVYPSSLPDSEIKLIRETLHRALLGLGFRDGVFHVEARVRRSQMEYRVENGIQDLRPKNYMPTEAPGIFLIEINARAPGTASTWPTYQTHGVNFTALQMLDGIGDRKRFRALSQPFLNGHQQWTHLVSIPILRGGIIANDYFQELCEKVPRLVPHIIRSACYMTKGQEVPEPTATRLGCIAVFTVMSKQSRSHLLQLTTELRRNLEIRWI